MGDSGAKRAPELNMERGQSNRGVKDGDRRVALSAGDSDTRGDGGVVDEVCVVAGVRAGDTYDTCPG